MDEEGDQIPWDVFFYREPIVRHITENGITRVEKWEKPRHRGESSALHYEANPIDFWENELMALVEETNSVIYSVSGGIKIWGDGVRLRLPYLWIYDNTNDDLVSNIITGIKVSLQNRDILGY